MENWQAAPTKPSWQTHFAMQVKLPNSQKLFLELFRISKNEQFPLPEQSFTQTALKVSHFPIN
jgi:hypothetical protein